MISDDDMTGATDAEIDDYVARMTDNAEDAAALTMALKNSANREAALADPYWLDLTNKAAAEHRGDPWAPPETHTSTEENDQ
ncbi:hypothetical protein GS462_11280 [Rhodococcus hoagii]|nr:hypothetical protein [Prescottella equi]MBM4650994.1 hypothetical protein [Prescottella equi]MBM4686659.1 hypothetical protein [Prescottella equi]